MNDKLQTVEPTTLKPNPWNTNIVGAENETKLEESIKKFGMFKPVIVRTLKNGSLEILGGEHRAAAAVRLGIKTIPVFNLGEIDDVQAKQIGLVDNGRYGNDDALGLAALLKEIGGVEELESFMPYTEQDFANIMDVGSSISLDDLDDLGTLASVAASTPLAKVAKATTIMRFKVAIEDSERISQIINDVIKAQGLTEGDALTNAGDALVHILNEATE